MFGLRVRGGLAVVWAIVLSAALSAALAFSPPALTNEGGVGETDEGTDASSRTLLPLARILEHLQRSYYRDIPLEEMVEAAIDGALGVLEDPHTVYLRPSDYEEFQIDVEGSYGGIGVEIEEQGDVVVIRTPFPGSPAEKAGLQPGDRIIRVNGHDVIRERARVVANHIRGPEGTTVTLWIQRGDGDPFAVTLQREIIQLKPLESRLIGEDLGYIRIHRFFVGTAGEVQQAYARLREAGISGLILDLRNNPGGLLQEAVDTAEIFVPQGTILQVVSRSGPPRSYRTAPSDPPPPIAILVNEGTASAAEIVAAAIRDHELGVLIGRRTYGKGTVQSIVEFEDGSALKYTTSEYLTPKGVSVTGTGLEPDVPVERELGKREAAGTPVSFAPLTGRYELVRGDRGLEVEGLQERLRVLGFDPGPIDGLFGPKTEKALAAFQADRGMVASGRLDAHTVQELQASLERRFREESKQSSEEDPFLRRAEAWLREQVLEGSR